MTSPPGWWPAAAAGTIVLAAAILLWMGREPICKCGYVSLWHGTVNDSGNSQHLTDWYTPSHVIHGFLFYGLTWLALRRAGFWPRLALATLLEAAWEIAENTPAVIEHYRTATISLDYYGDSVLNSVSDILAMWLGFWLASRLPVWLSVAIVGVLELFVGWMIRDNLTLNVLMLLWPLDSVKAWQGGG
ncbi:DUF2585 domain-containing protein [Falsiroseomonas sp. HW251]|uniref:DUF2585 domain-containing protein n=1 Tax=Falsiroseomonas sp. HW251 TaxID=3390998 RepID=UPI003D311E4D